MKKIFYFVFVLFISLIFINGCLTVEKKEYKIKLTSPTSGKGTIKYINILSQKDNEKDVSMKDFAELITDYIEGDKIQNDFPGISNVKKRVFEENGVLCAEFSFDFDSLNQIKLFKYDKDSPFMLMVKESFSNEEYVESNGEYNINNMPVIFWNKNTKEFSWKTKVATDSANTISLLEQYKSWDKSRKNK
ncbi:MAG: hypothetical protein EPN82_13700 [Bacteroidetes bacterium]|nr:MAG: hypothetical protein EPN82_13700 [Bacteroidota bacterium]